jgi:hypothetical protein
MTTLNSIASQGTSDDSHLLFADHHVAIEDACRELLARAFTDDPRELIAQYRTFERAVLDHFKTEEVAILPAYSAHAPADTRAIRHEHTVIRQLLSEIGMDIELHHVRCEAIAELIRILRAHAAHEDAAMYRWADTHLQTRRA